jgi:cell wall-associated NlpC family hydrolase
MFKKFKIKKIKKLFLISSLLISYNAYAAKNTKENNEKKLSSYFKKQMRKDIVFKSRKNKKQTRYKSCSTNYNKIIKTARKYLGTKYKYGGFDCSKFVQTVMKKTKTKNLPRTTRQQIKIGKHISKHNAKKGDLIFFGDSKHNVGHVGIIIDPKRMLMIHNSSAKGKVTISSYNTKYYNRKYRGIRRV